MCVGGGGGAGGGGLRRCGEFLVCLFACLLDLWTLARTVVC